MDLRKGVEIALNQVLNINSGWNLQDALSIKPFELKRYAK